MLRILKRPGVRTFQVKLECQSSHRRNFTYLSTHTVFPATLYRFQIHLKSNLYDIRLEEDVWDLNADRVQVSEHDGLVHPYVSSAFSNGASFKPNTQFMQEVTRQFYNNYRDAIDNGQPPADPHYLCIPKGTTIPDDLTLYREQTSWFSLQPSRPITLEALNNALTEFYMKSGVVIPAEEWLKEHPYQEASSDDSEEWMNR
ncbi:hypothetical protein C8Q75DRAFT_801215 [Abortiporus biennis]|nr:hypothetical protein C8Q75DRAFT_801215 [Abortiporus biennis]